MQHHLKIRHRAAKKKRKEKGVEASLTEVTHSFLEHDSFLKLTAMYELEEGVWCRGMSVMPYIYIPCPLASVQYMKAGPLRHTEALCKQEGGSKHARVLQVAVELTELHFNLKRAYQTEDVGQPMTQGRKYPRLQLNQVYRWCKLQVENFQGFFCIKVAFFNQFLHIQPQMSRQPHLPPQPGPPSPKRFNSSFQRYDKNVRQPGKRQQWRVGACHKIILPNTMLSVPQIKAVIRVQDK